MSCLKKILEEAISLEFENCGAQGELRVAAKAYMAAGGSLTEFLLHDPMDLRNTVLYGAWANPALFERLAGVFVSSDEAGAEERAATVDRIREMRLFASDPDALLFRAIREGDARAARRAGERGAEPNTVDGNGKTPPLRHGNNLGIVEVLAEFGAANPDNVVRRGFGNRRRGAFVAAMESGRASGKRREERPKRTGARKKAAFARKPVSSDCSR